MKSKKTPASLRCFWTFAVLAVLASQAKANLVVDPGFELPAVTPGGYQDFTTGMTIDGAWTVQGNDVGILTSTYSEPGITFNANSGNQSLDLTGVGINPGTGVTQSIPTTASTGYTLTFYLGVADDSTSGNTYYTAPAILSLSIGGGTPTSYTNANLTPGSVNWLQETVPFTASSSSTSLTFLVGETSQFVNFIGLDDVSVTANNVVSVVPEPNTLVLGGIGAVLACWAKFRRRRKTATA